MAGSAGPAGSAVVPTAEQPLAPGRRACLCLEATTDLERERERERWGSEGTRLAGETSVPSGRQTSNLQGPKFQQSLTKGAGELAVLVLQGSARE